MNTISYEDVVFTGGAIWLHRAAGKIAASLLPERVMRVRIKESSFCLRCFEDKAREFPDGGGKADADPCRDNLLGGE